MDAQVSQVAEKYSFFELFDGGYWISKGFVVGLGRDIPHPKISHLYKGTFDDVGDPLCWRGWNREDGNSFSIWRNNIGEDGVCKMCIRHARRIIKQKEQST